MSNKIKDGWGLYINGEDFHVCPQSDLRDHYISRHCWCNPEETDPEVWVHNSIDRREEYEQGRKMS